MLININMVKMVSSMCVYSSNYKEHVLNAWDLKLSQEFKMALI